MKNIKPFKRLLSLIAATMMMTTPALANADGENENTTGFTLVKQEMKVEGNDLNINNYQTKLFYQKDIHQHNQYHQSSIKRILYKPNLLLSLA